MPQDFAHIASIAGHFVAPIFPAPSGVRRQVASISSPNDSSQVIVGPLKTAGTTQFQTQNMTVTANEVAIAQAKR
jgi:hypothetical protein